MAGGNTGSGRRERDTVSIWVIDDDPDFREVLQATAPGWLAVVTSSCSREAMDYARRLSPDAIDLIVLDVQLPPELDTSGEAEGPALLEWLRRRGLDVPAVLVSSHVRPSELSASLARTILGFLRKPVDLDRLHRFLGAYADLFRS